MQETYYKSQDLSLASKQGQRCFAILTLIPALSLLCAILI